MTGDARGEAEQIVGKIVVNETIVLPWVKDIKAWHEHQEAVVAALAAAIEETDAEDELDRLRSRPGTDTHALLDAEGRVVMARRHRRSALSALRARAGEEI